MDVCEQPNTSACRLSPWDWSYCSDPNCDPCAVGEGDCDSDAECQSGLVYAQDVGLDYGQISSMDVCQTPRFAHDRSGIGPIVRIRTVAPAIAVKVTATRIVNVRLGSCVGMMSARTMVRTLRLMFVSGLTADSPIMA